MAQEENRPVVEKSDVYVVPRGCFPEIDFQSTSTSSIGDNVGTLS